MDRFPPRSQGHEPPPHIERYQRARQGTDADENDDYSGCAVFCPGRLCGNGSSCYDGSSPRRGRHHGRRDVDQSRGGFVGELCSILAVEPEGECVGVQEDLYSIYSSY